MVKHDRKERSQFEFELKTVFEKSQATNNQKVSNEYESDDEEIIPANDMIGVKQPVLQICHNGKKKEDSETSDDDDDNSDSE